MKYKTENIQVKEYEYECIECGNTFRRSNGNLDVYKCHDCSSVDYPFSKIIVENSEIKKEQYCPICEDYFEVSKYLEDAIEHEHVRWLANMITHYRHEHITSWNNTWNRGEYGGRYLSEFTYEKEKIKVNERAKRQILRKCKKEMIKDGFKVEHVKQLQHTDNKTIELYEKYLKS